MAYVNLCSMDVQGILIRKTDYKERDVIVDLLLRNGKQMAVYFYGGKGGGKYQKGSLLEVGRMLKVNLKPNTKHGQDSLAVAQEWSIIWDLEFIRNDFKGFYYLCFLLELTKKIAIETQMKDYDEKAQEFVGLFSVLSNGLYYLDEALKNKNFVMEKHLFIFLSKLIYQLGIMPDDSQCGHCHADLNRVQSLFSPKDGQFICLNCQSQGHEFFSDQLNIGPLLAESEMQRKELTRWSQLPFKDWALMFELSKKIPENLFHYICMQCHLDRASFKTTAFLW